MTGRILIGFILQEVWIVREVLARHGGDRRSNQQRKCPVEAWSSYCRDIGSSRQFVNRWPVVCEGRATVKQGSMVLDRQATASPTLGTPEPVASAATGQMEAADDDVLAGIFEELDATPPDVSVRLHIVGAS